ncbi:MAG: asparagine synthase (glutamine-hydrolyzing) [Flavobacteriales bacterium]|nr:asparagine synthase (glutamine-hydrolyzing) [Flavobacteriales bacterium]
MCGINGLFGLEKIERPQETVQKMNACLTHRGPDADGLYADEHVVLGHKRLSIIDLDEKANQPMTSANGRFVLVYNGELYNYRALKEQVPNYPYKTESDSEVVLAAITEWGMAALQAFNGMFAFALWDSEKGELFLVRDRIGIKPLYYAESQNSLIFSSEIRAILETDLVPKKMDPEALIDYLRYATVHGPRTIIQGIKMLEPGHYLKISDNETEEVKYFELGARNNSRKRDSYDTKKNIRILLTESVEKRTVSDVPFGAFLSGGIDSSIIVGLMSEVIPGKVNTFSVVFDEQEHSEAKYSQMIAKKYQTNHHEIKLRMNDLLDMIPSTLAAMDHPSGDGPNTYLVSKKTKDAGITMALSGLGGDELFAGYDLFKYCAEISQKKWVTSFPMFVRKMAGSVYSGVKKDVASSKVKDLLVQDHFDLEYIYPKMRTVLRDEEVLNLLDRETLPESSVFQIGKDKISFEGTAFKLPYLSKISVLEFNTYMSNVLLRDSDQMGMANAMEIRVPFLDHELVEYVLGLSDQEKYPHSPKKLLVDTFQDLLPSELVNRPKMGFTFPWTKWMKKDLKPFCERQLKGLKKRTQFSTNAIDLLWSRFLNNDPNITWSRIWHLVVLEHWLSANGIDE